MKSYLLYNEIPERLSLYVIDTTVISVQELEKINGHCVNGDSPTTEKDQILDKVWKHIQDLEPLNFPCEVAGVVYSLDFIM